MQQCQRRLEQYLGWFAAVRQGFVAAGAGLRHTHVDLQQALRCHIENGYELHSTTQWQLFVGGTAAKRCLRRMAPVTMSFWTTLWNIQPPLSCHRQLQGGHISIHPALQNKQRMAPIVRFCFSRICGKVTPHVLPQATSRGSPFKEICPKEHTVHGSHCWSPTPVQHRSETVASKNRTATHALGCSIAA